MRSLAAVVAWVSVLVFAASGAAAFAQSSDAAPSDDLLQLAVNAASNALGVSSDSLVVVATAQQDWPDSSLGCPQPGLAYSQIVTPGWLITIDTSDATAEVQVHTNNATRAVIC